MSFHENAGAGQSAEPGQSVNPGQHAEPGGRAPSVAEGPVAQLLADLAALVWPVECAGCGAPNRACCQPCRAEMVRAALAAGADSSECVCAGHPTASHPSIILGTPTVPAAPPHFTGGSHEGVLRDLLVAFKHAGRTSLAPTLGEVLAVPLARAVELTHGPAPPLIVPIPSRPSRVRERGFHHVELLARAALRVLGRAGRVPATTSVVRALRTLPGRTTQVGLRAGERRRNAARITIRSAARKKVLGREVILLDDVRTTGETLAAAAIVLNKMGVKVIATVTLVQAKRHAPRK